MTNNNSNDNEFISDTIRDVKEQLKEAKRKIKEAKREAKREAKEKVREAREKAKEDFVRINFTLPQQMKEDWKNMAKNLSKSVSQLVRDAMGLYKTEIYNVEKVLTEKGEKIDKLGEKFGKEMGMLGDKFAKIVEGTTAKRPRHPKAPTPPTPSIPSFPSEFHDEIEIERLKKRVEGLIKIQKKIPVDKLAQALKISVEDAENLIYEIVAEGINGTLENNVFNFTNDPDEVISTINEALERMYRH